MPSSVSPLIEKVRSASPEEAKEALLQVIRLAREIKRKNPLELYKPIPKALLFHKSPKKRRWYVGANRSSKSESTVVEDCWWATGSHPFREVPPTNDGWVVCQSISAQTQAGGIQEKFQKYFPRHRIAETQRGGLGAWAKIIVTCPSCSLGPANVNEPRCQGCGRRLSTLAFKTYEQSIDIFAGAEIDWVHFDEEPPLDIRTECSFRLSKPRGGWEWGAMTPVKGLSWTHPRIGKPFFDARKKGEEHPEIDVIQATMFDNLENLGQAYIDSQIAECKGDDRLYRIRILGEWTTLAGLVFPHWDPAKNEFEDLPPNFLSEGKIHPDFETYVGIDTGYHFAAIWLLSDYMGNLWLFDELHAEKQPTNKLAQEVKRKNSFWGINPLYVIDRASSFDVEFAEYGIYCDKALQITREEGNDIVSNYIASRGAQDGRPMLIACTARVPEYLRQLSIYQHAPPLKSGPNQGAQKDDVVKRDDHGLDAARFVISKRPPASRPSPDRDRRSIHVKFLEGVKKRYAEESEREAMGDDMQIYEG